MRKSVSFNVGLKAAHNARSAADQPRALRRLHLPAGADGRRHQMGLVAVIQTGYSAMRCSARDALVSSNSMYWRDDILG
jgi:hypothetical protein